MISCNFIFYNEICSVSIQYIYINLIIYLVCLFNIGHNAFLSVMNFPLWFGLRGIRGKAAFERLTRYRKDQSEVI